MKAGYKIETGFGLPNKNTTHILVYNWHQLNVIGFSPYSFKSDKTFEQLPVIQHLVAIFKIKPKCSEKKSS